MRRAFAALLSVGVAAVGLPAAAAADHSQESVFQDDQYLLYASAATVDSTLTVLRSLGVDRVRVTVKWSALAPDPASPTRPPGFDAANPAAYPIGAWTPYDRVLTLAEQHGIGVEFNLTAPGPLWAVRAGAPTTAAADHWVPDSASFGKFADAVGTRYSGRYGGLPRVNVWSIWNEPNQPGWLAPQSLSSNGKQVPISPMLYRSYIAAGFRGLYLSGHTLSRDTILIGELAPEGYEQPGTLTAMTPMVFLRALYCIDGGYRRLRGAAASAIGCPSGGSSRSFVDGNVGLFDATGFAHHPYYFFWPPQHSAGDSNFVPLANLARLERGLDRAFGAYGVHRRIPIYLTEYGYQTNPPDPYEIVTPAEQARYLNLADYMAWRDGRVRSVAQFLLRDSLPNVNYARSDPQYWDTFQTGLEYANGKPKPAYASYRMPIWIPSPSVARGRPVFVWGQLRPARPHGAVWARVEFARRGGSYRSIAVVATRNRRGYLTASVRVPASGYVRIAWGGLASRGVWVALR